MSQQNPLLWFGLFVALSLATLVAGQAQLLDRPRDIGSQLVAPLQSGASRVGRWVRGLGAWQEVQQLRAENAALRRTVDDLLQETVRLRAADLENRQLREQLRYAEANPQHTFLPVDVIGYDSSSLLSYITLNQGKLARLEEGMVVTSPAGLVGRVVSVAAAKSAVLPITHPTSAVNAIVQGTDRATGVVTGRADGRLLLKYVPQTETIRIHDVVVTSGLGGAFPRHVPIGRVVQLRTRDAEMFQEADVEPFAQLRHLDRGLVITNFRPQT